MKRNFSNEILVGSLFILFAIFVWWSWPNKYSPKAPWWYNNSDVGWVMDNSIPAVGADEISQRIINFEDIKRSTADGTVYTWSFNRSLMMQMQDDKNDGPIKLRYATGQSGIFAGNMIQGNELKINPQTQIHPPLTEPEIRSMVSHWDNKTDQEEYVQDCLREVKHYLKHAKAEQED